MLVTRFKKYTNELSIEIPFIKKLKKVLDDYCKGKEIGIKIVMIKEFSDDLNTILDLYVGTEYEEMLNEIDLLVTLDDI